MRIITSILIALLLYGLPVNSQTNLIRNGSFEDTITSNVYANYADGIEQIVPPWFSSINSPDFFSPGGKYSNSRGMPSNICGFQYAQNGLCYAGLSLYSYNTPSYNTTGKNTREWIGQKLESPLKKNMIYNYEYYISRPELLNFSTTQIGLFFKYDSVRIQTFNGVYLTNDFFPYPDSIEYLALSPADTFLTDTVNWVKISGQYIAKGGEQYVYVGNMKPDSITQLQYYYFPTPNTDFNGSYYYIDNVSLVETGILSVEENKPKNIAFYPNPTTGDLYIVNPQDKTLQVEIVSPLGQTVYKQQLPGGTNYLNMNGLANGMYLVRVVDKQALVAIQKLIINK